MADSGEQRRWTLTGNGPVMYGESAIDVDGPDLAEDERVSVVEAVSDPECETCGGDGNDHGLQEPERSMNPCPDCYGTGKASGRSAPTDEDRIARALYDVERARAVLTLTWDQLPPTLREPYYESARAVLSVHTPTGELRARSLCDTKTDKLYGGVGKFPAQCWGCWEGRSSGVDVKAVREVAEELRAKAEWTDRAAGERTLAARLLSLASRLDSALAGGESEF